MSRREEETPFWETVAISEMLHRFSLFSFSMMGTALLYTFTPNFSAKRVYYWRSRNKNARLLSPQPFRNLTVSYQIISNENLQAIQPFKKYLCLLSWSGKPIIPSILHYYTLWCPHQACFLDLMWREGVEESLTQYSIAWTLCGLRALERDW